MERRFCFLLARLFGFRRIDMQGKDGSSVHGYSCFIGFQSPNVQGVECSKIYVSDDYCSKFSFVPSPNLLIDVGFSPAGRLVSIEADPDGELPF